MTAPAMPDPRRYARRNVALMERLGYDRVVAAMVVGIACESASRAFGEDGLAPNTWLHDVALEAAEMIAIEVRQRRAADNRTTGGTTA